MRPVVIAGAGMTKFGRLPDQSLEDLTRGAVWDAIDDSGIDPRRIGIAYLGNSFAGVLQGQESARAVTLLRNAGIGGMAMIHCESGTASASLAVHGAWLAVGSGEFDVAIAVGVEKLYVPGDPAASIAAISTSGERFVGQEMGLTALAGVWMEVEAVMERYGWTPTDIARVAEKNHRLGALNPRGESEHPTSIEEILGGRSVIGPLTRLMCASAAVDGAAAAILCSEEVARQAGAQRVELAACSLRGGKWMDDAEKERTPGLLSMDNTAEVFSEAYERAGVGPQDIDVFEAHDAIAAEELVSYEAIGLCAPGDGAGLIRDGRTDIGGDIPCNTDGGLVGRGHPVGATGLAQVCEMVWQLRGQAENRQVRHSGRLPRVAAIQNAGAQSVSGGEGVGASVGMLLKGSGSDR